MYFSNNSSDERQNCQHQQNENDILYTFYIARCTANIKCVALSVFFF